MFRSFFLGGFECATGFNREGHWIDLVAATWHDQHAHDDYRRLREVGILAARDAVRWPLVDRGGGHYDFTSIEPVVRAAHRHGVEVIWDLFHYGYPVGLDLLSDAFPQRFADYCGACARHLRRRLGGTLWFTPVNEPSFFAWAAGHDAQFAPHRHGQSADLKFALVRPALHGLRAILAAAPGARFVHADPLCRVVPPDDSPESVDAAREFNERHVYESWDMLCGRLRPELGGSRALLDVVGINYYWTSQWVHGRPREWLPDEDPRRQPLSVLVRQVWERYGGDILIAETMHWGDHRADWFRGLAREVERILADGIPLRGVCLYPILAMQDWHAPRHWLPMGLWDIDLSRGMGRVVHQPLLDALLDAQRRVPAWREAASRRPPAGGGLRRP